MGSLAVTEVRELHGGQLQGGLRYLGAPLRAGGACDDVAVCCRIGQGVEHFVLEWQDLRGQELVHDGVGQAQEVQNAITPLDDRFGDLDGAD